MCVWHVCQQIPEFPELQKNKEFRHLVCLHLGIKNIKNERIYIANYHWNCLLLNFLKKNNKYRTSFLTKREAQQFDITEIINSHNKEGKQ